MNHEPFDCNRCRRRIGGRAWHHVYVEHHMVLCGRCSMSGGSHAELFPTCAERWHDMGDHGPVIFAVRSAVERVLAHHHDEISRRP